MTRWGARKHFIILLIEPVWNRNSDFDGVDLHLLPAFNRTSMESKRGQRAICQDFCNLLIEPVWNRNSSEIRCIRKSTPSFNRTSMESKPSLAK